jgi:hypothetical protein
MRKESVTRNKSDLYQRRNDLSTIFGLVINYCNAESGPEYDFLIRHTEPLLQWNDIFLISIRAYFSKVFNLKQSYLIHNANAL